MKRNWMALSTLAALWFGVWIGCGDASPPSDKNDGDPPVSAAMDDIATRTTPLEDEESGADDSTDLAPIDSTPFDQPLPQAGDLIAEPSTSADQVAESPELPADVAPLEPSPPEAEQAPVEQAPPDRTPIDSLLPIEPLKPVVPAGDESGAEPTEAATTPIDDDTPETSATTTEIQASPLEFESPEQGIVTTPIAADETPQPAIDRSVLPIVNEDQADAESHGEDDSGYGGSGHSVKKTPAEFVALNGPIFEGWETPTAAVLISGEQLGYIEPCGCAGLENQKGGLARRHSLIAELTKKGWPLARVDLGAQIRRFGTQSEIKFRVSTNALAQLNYGAVGFGPQDLRLTAEEILGVALNLPGGESPFVTANIEFSDLGDLFVKPYRVTMAGPRRIAVASILGKKYQALVNNPDLKFSDPAVALAKIVPKMQQEGDLLILLAHATPDESRALAKAFPQFHLVVTAGAAEEPPIVPERVPGSNNLLIEVGHKGMYVAVIGIYDEPRPTLRYQRVPLDGRFPDSPEMKQVMARYQSELQTLGLEGLGLLRGGTPTRSHPSGNRFQGSQTCADCHTSAHAVWENTPHAHATQTLVDLKPARHFDPECLSCHVTGWEPQQYVPLTGGYLDLKTTPHLKTNGCENCHGPAAEHAQVELGELEVSDAMREQLRAALRMKLEPGEAEGEVVGAVTQTCLKCHDLDNSPDFKFKTYWPEVAHEGKD